MSKHYNYNYHANQETDSYESKESEVNIPVENEAPVEPVIEEETPIMKELTEEDNMVDPHRSIENAMLNCCCIPNGLNNIRSLKEVEITGCSSLRLREEPNTNSKILAEIPAGEKLLVDDVDISGFYRTCFSDKIGYIMIKFTK